MNFFVPSCAGSLEKGDFLLSYSPGNPFSLLFLRVLPFRPLSNLLEVKIYVSQFLFLLSIFNFLLGTLPDIYIILVLPGSRSYFFSHISNLVWQLWTAHCPTG